ncbi:MAG TPA: Stp1/IreP family PP2C-type Ser/Thr phosphatase [Acidimicrobiales bacterium]|nr:Stp1/IreP family PP2C-type Ser/Thr phosphatase [Acidimicrobiales bacterium]
MTRLIAAAATDAGRVRTSNQDRSLVAAGVVAVADGMGGHAGGEIAASTAVEAFARAIEQDRSAEGLAAAAVVANREVFARAERDEALRGMGTTLTAAALVENGGQPRIALVNVGDSRAYLFEDGGLRQLTEDHSLVEEMVRRGELTPEAALTHPHRHILTRALGIDPGVEIDSWLLSPAPDSRLLLCSDGLTNECSEQEIAEVLAHERDPQAAADSLVAKALEHGGSDNITVVVADLKADGEPSADAAGEATVAAAAVAVPVPQGAEGIVGETTAVPTQPRLHSSATAPTERVRRAVPPRPSRAERPRPPKPTRDERRAARRSNEPIMTVRVAFFVLVLIAILGGIAGFVIWFNRATYYVGLSGDHVAIFEGRPGGFLWFHPTLVEDTPLMTSQVLPANLPILRQGVLESSYDGARTVVSNLTNEQGLLSLGATSTTTTSTVPVTTLAPTATTGAVTTTLAKSPTTTTTKAATTSTKAGH